MTYCDACDVEGPHIEGPFFTSYEMLEAHRAVHRLARELLKVAVEPIFNKLFRGVK